MKRNMFLVLLAALCLSVVGVAQAEMTDAELIADAESAAPESVTGNATIKAADGRVLREGTSSWTCYPGQDIIGPMCNQAQWDKALGAMLSKQPIDIEEWSVSYMLAGEGRALGVSNIDPYAAAPSDDNDWVKEGPHLMILVPDAAALEGLSTDPSDPVYVMWKGTDYAHIMVKIAAEE